MHREARKTVSIVYSDIAGSTALGDRLDPESLRRAMIRYFEVVQNVHERHGGVVEKFIGDAVMAVFGMPYVHEDDALRAVRAACELREAVAALNRELERELEVTLPVRTGVNTGLVLAGDPDQGHAFVSGDTVNMTARLERAAGPGEVLLGQATYRLVADAVRVQPLDPFVPRGKAAPVAAYRLLEVTPGAMVGLARCLESPLLGRALELAVLHDALDQAVAGQACQLVTVLGDAGVGKSRLLRAFTDQAGERAVVLQTCCPSYGKATAVQVVGQLVAQAEALAPGNVHQPVDPTAVTVDPLSVFRSIRLLLKALAKGRPVVIVVDDLHWADPVLLDLVRYLHAFTRDVALLVVVGARHQLLNRRSLQMVGTAHIALNLEPLPADQAAELAANLRGPRGLDADARKRIAAWAEGNPLFIEELLRSLNDGAACGQADGDGALPVPDQLDELPVPPAVEALLEAELDCLPPTERTVLELASVIGRIFDWASVVRLAPAQLRPRVGALLLALAGRNIIRVADRGWGEDVFTFRNRFVRDAAYQAIPKQERVILHVQLAELVAEAAGEGNEAVGRHLGQAYRYLTQLAGDGLSPPKPQVSRWTARLPQ
jgi:class 3 adenylate cyclase